jgi:hypothetical protein
MKIITKLILLGIITLISASCSKSNDPEASDVGVSGNKKTAGTMKAIIGGKAWEAKTVSFKGGLTGDLYDASGFVTELERISLQFVNSNNLQLNKLYALDTKITAANLNGNVSYYVNGNNYMSKEGIFMITKFKKGNILREKLTS